LSASGMRGPELRELGNEQALGRYSRPMSEAKPDPSGSTGEFRAFVERGAADSKRRTGLRNPTVIIAAAVAVLIVILVVAVTVH
jgi:hypothetical protein